MATDEEVQAYIERYSLFGMGIGYVDANLLAGTSITVGAQIWTRDRRLSAAAERVGLNANLMN